MAEKIYCGNAMTVNVPYPPKWQIQILFYAKDLEIMKEHLSNGRVKVDLVKRKQDTPKGSTHYCTVNTYVPKSKRAEGQSEAPESAPVVVNEDEHGFDEVAGVDLPF